MSSNDIGSISRGKITLGGARRIRCVDLVLKTVKCSWWLLSRRIIRLYLNFKNFILGNRLKRS